MVGFRSMEISHHEIAPDVVVVTIAGKVMMGPESEQITTFVSDLLREAKRIIIFNIACGRSLQSPVAPMSNANSILIVDDDPDIHHLLAAALSDGNYLIEERYDGLEALIPSSKPNRVTRSLRLCGCRDSVASNCFEEFTRVRRSMW
jgi:PleD family two-component response regulator